MEMERPQQRVGAGAAAAMGPELAMSGEGDGGELAKNGAVEVPWEGPAEAQVGGALELLGEWCFFLGQ